MIKHVVQFFPKTGKVSVDYSPIGEYRQPDPSGAAHARSPKWIFTAYDGRVAQGARRKDLHDFAIAAYRRKHIEC